MASLVGAGTERFGFRKTHECPSSWPNLFRPSTSCLSSITTGAELAKLPHIGTRRTQAGLGPPRSADKCTDHVGVIDSERALDTGRHIDAVRACDAIGLREIAKIEPARQHEWLAGIEPFEKMPVERHAEPAGAGGILRRTRVEQNAVCDGGIG